MQKTRNLYQKFLYRPNPEAGPMVTFSARLSLFLLSSGTLVFEINLSRLFSVTQFYHFAYMIVSLALLGFGASGTFLAIFPQAGRQQPARTLAVLALGASMSILGAYWLTNRLPFDSFSIAWDRRQVGILAAHYLALALPFFFSGLAVGLLLSVYPRSAGKVYAVNLTGSALGCLGALAAPPLVGGEGTVVLSSSLAALAGVILFRKDRKIASLLAGLVLAANLFALGWQVLRKNPLPLYELNLSPYKSLSYALQVPGAEVSTQRWNTFSRVDLVSSPSIRSMPGISFRYLDPPPPEQGLFVDGDNLNPVVQLEADLAFTDFLPAALAFELRPEARALVLEPGGGIDLLTAVYQGAAYVKAVEPNPLVVEAAAHIYSLEAVETVYETGRSYLRRSRERFDVVLFSLTSTYHPVRSGAYSLRENYSFTLEAYQDALERLEDDGILVITRWLQTPPSEWLRSFILAVTALEGQGLDPGQRLIAMRSFNLGLLLVRKTPYTPAELETARRFASERAFDLVHLPGLQPEETNRFNILPEDAYFQAFTGFLAAADRQAWLVEYPYQVSPPTDDHPFFGHYFKWSQAPQILAELGMTWQPFGGAGYFVLLLLLALAFVLATAIILLPLILGRKTSAPSQTSAACFAYFGLLGLAFLLVEIPLLQRFILYLGNPAYAMSTALFAILLFSGLGSHFAGRLPQRGALTGLILVILVTPWLLPRLFELTLGFPLLARIGLSIAALAPLGFLMGMPFPNGIQILENTAPGLIPWAWGVNGALSVISSLLAALIALSFGFRWALLAGAVCYAGAWAAAPFLKIRAKEPDPTG
jgi:hypothetical protein